MKAAALIPCRVGSKGVPNKNFRDFCGKPLIQWTIDAARESNIFDKIIVSSNGGLEISGCEQNIEYDNDRALEHSTDEAPLDPLLKHYAIQTNETNPDIKIWCLLQPTSPLRTTEDIQKAYKKACFKKYDALVSVTPNPGMFWIEGAVSSGNIATYPVAKRPNRQDRKGWHMENGAIYFTKTYTIWHTNCRCAGSVGLYKMPPERSAEIDTEYDWKFCEFLMREAGRCQQS